MNFYSVLIAPEHRLAIKAVQSKHALAVQAMPLDLCLLRMQLAQPWTLQWAFHTAQKFSYRAGFAATLIGIQGLSASEGSSMSDGPVSTVFPLPDEPSMQELHNRITPFCRYQAL